VLGARLNTESALKIVKKVLAADFACSESDFDREGVFIYEAREIEGARRFPIRKKALNIATMGKGVVVSCTPDRLEWAKENLSNRSKDEIFSESTTSLIAEYIAADNQIIRSPDLKYICVPGRFLPYSPTEDVKLTALGYEEIKHYFETQEFYYAIGERDNPEKIHEIAVSAVCNGKVAGIAAASEDCDEMYQVGVSVLAEYRNKGIGRAVVGKVTEMIFDMGKLPYYSTWASNIASRRLNISLGYFPAWIELYAMDRGER
jgi:GNAT superfamily N-acetyltransferase